MPLPDGLREALGQVIADQRREWRRERELIEAQGRETIAELRASVAELRAENTAQRADGAAVLARVEEMVRERLATLKDGEPGASVTVEDVAPILAAEIDRRFGDLAIPRDGQDAKPEDIERAVQVEVERRLADIADRAATQIVVPEPIHGRDADMDQIRSHLTAEVERVVGEIPRPKDGNPGKDVDAAEVLRMVEEAVAALPRAEPGKPGASVTLEDVRPLIEQEVQLRVGELSIPKDGEPGPPGPPGKLPIVRVWAEHVHYEGDVVTHDGATWQAQRDTGRAPPHDDWLCIAAAGTGGQDGRSMTVRGTWAEGETYRHLDVVALNGAGFVARHDDPGPCPGEGWQMIAAQGKRGEAVRLRGDPGPAGPKVAGLSIDEEGMLTLTNADGSKVNLDLYPLLSKIAHS